MERGREGVVVRDKSPERDAVEAEIEDVTGTVGAEEVP